MSSPVPDEGRVRVGTRGWVKGFVFPRIAVTVVEIRLLPDRRKVGAYTLGARCDDGSGETRWIPVDEVYTDDER